MKNPLALAAMFVGGAAASSASPASASCPITLPVSYLSPSSAYLQNTFATLTETRALAFPSLDAKDMRKVLAQPVSLKATESNAAEVTEFISHLRRAYELLKLHRRPVLFLDKLAFPVLPGLWDAPLETFTELADAAVSLARKSAAGDWVPVVGAESPRRWWQLERDEPLLPRVAWGDAQKWARAAKMRWLNSPHSLLSPKVEAAVDEDFPWDLIKTDSNDSQLAGTTLFQSAAAGENATSSSTPALSAPAGPAAAAAVSYIAHPRLLKRLERLVVHRDGGDQYLCVQPCTAANGFEKISKLSYASRLELFTTHPFADSESGAAAHGKAVEQALVELAWSVPGNQSLEDDFPGLPWTTAQAADGLILREPPSRTFRLLVVSNALLIILALAAVVRNRQRRRAKEGAIILRPRRLRITLRDSLSPVTLRTYARHDGELDEDSAAALNGEDEPNAPFFLLSTPPR